MTQQVVPFGAARATVRERALSWLGARPTLTLTAGSGDGALCCSVRLVRAGRDRWVGLVAAQGAFVERVRLDGKTAFDVHVHGAPSPLCGEAHVEVLGDPSRLDVEVQQAIMVLTHEHPFPARQTAVVAVYPQGLVLDETEHAAGAVPRT